MLMYDEKICLLQGDNQYLRNKLARYKKAFEMSGILEHAKLGDMAPPLRLNVSDSKNIVKQIEGE